jgi:hypothetical protein
MSEELQQVAVEDVAPPPNMEADGEVAEAPEVDEETLSEAKRQGWVPQEDYNGPEDKWVDADTFVKKGKEINALLRKDNEFLKREVSEMKSTMMEFKKFHADTEKRAYERAMLDLREQKKEAIAAGDGEKVLQVDDAIDELKTARREEKIAAPAPNQIDPTFIAWQEDNRWFGKDTELTAEANLIGEVVKRQNPTLIGTEFLDEVTKRVKRMYPEKFTNANRSRPNPVESSTAKPAGSRGKGFNDLPPDAKAACQKFEKQGLVTRDQYIKEYFGE